MKSEDHPKNLKLNDRWVRAVLYVKVSPAQKTVSLT